MMVLKRGLFLFILIILLVLLYYFLKPTPLKRVDAWVQVFKGLGTLSSPRLADVSGDGVLDVIMGAGKTEFLPSDSAIIALDGATGRLRWAVAARDQIFGSPLFKDITEDGIFDVFIGGRSAELKAINGKTGEIIWDYFLDHVQNSPSDSGQYNFYNPQFIPDQDDDGHEDLIIAAGGYVKALPDDPHRPPGRLLVISSASGRILAAAEMPDGKEIYMSVLTADFNGDGYWSVIFGTGGETLGGSLYKVALDDLLKNDLSSSSVLEPGHDKGFIAPPVLADITADGILDIVANSVNGRMIAIDGASEKVLWRVHIPGTEAYCSIAVGFFTEDDVPDFCTNYGIGTWPDLDQSIQFMVNGKTGKISFSDTLGIFQESTPVAIDYNQDGVDDGLYSFNFQQKQSGYSNQLMVIDFLGDTSYQIDRRNFGGNVASTPWIGDMDFDGYVDLVYTNEINPFDLLSVTYKKGLKITRVKTEIPVTQPLPWGAYMGSNYDGTFSGKPRKPPSR